MRKITVMVLALSLAGCALDPNKPHSIVNPAPVVQKTSVKAAPVKHQEPCPCSPTANQVVKKRWFSGWRFFH